MKRHSSLVPVSRQHHQLLVLAQLLKSDVPAYEGMPGTIEEKKNYLASKFQEIILPNINLHRKQLYPAFQDWGFSEIGLIESLQIQEDDILFCAKEIINTENAEEDQLNDLGYSLDKMVRTRERELYEAVQNRFSEELEKLKLQL